MEFGKVKVLIIDNDVEWVKKLTILINQEDDMVVVGSSFIKLGVCELVQIMKPDIILLDVFPGNWNWEGVHLIHSIRKICNSKIIVVTMAQEPEFVKTTLFAGAKEFIIKENIKMLPEIIRVIAKRWSAAEIMTQVVNEYEKIVFETRKEEILKSINLTPTERRIYRCLERRLTRIQIARELDISENTVKNHITNILNKAEVENSKEAVSKISNMI